MAKQSASTRGAQQDAGGERESGVWEKVVTPQPEDPTARLAALYRAEEGPLLALLLRRVPAQVAVDLRAETFLVFTQRVREKGFPEPPRPRLLRIAANLVKNHRRAQRRLRERYAGEDVDALPRSQRDAEQATIGAEVRRLVDELLRELPDEDAWIIRRVELEGVPYEEAAATLGLRPDAARKRLSRAKTKLRELAKSRAREW
jgi:RNA polymerase sigma-70 factor (ECF subfamily)